MKLYVIGNGFDVHHGLDTKYTSFGLYLKKNYRDVYNLLLEHFGFTDLDPDFPSSMLDPLWSEFESSMSGLSTDSVLEANMDAMPNYASDDFRDRDRYTLEIEMERILGYLTTDLYKAFKEFILAVEFPEFNMGNAVNLDKNAMYLTFNYTDTLTYYYGIPDNNILFIHGKAENDDQELILGHGVDPENFKEKPVGPPKDLNDEEYEQWAEYQSAQYDYSFERGKHAINRYFSATFKGTEEIIENHKEFFSSLHNVDEIYILGHSLADVDLPYFRKLKQSVKPAIKWVATFYAPQDEQRHMDILKALNVSNVSVIRMNEV
ncbi:bacteriophage abortive infection AbiH family protein [Acinetobacter seifertii]|uniref:bacteriophage abortive infection AbiH family protein n=1 Tax=Acinetobacter seifertii TaxID=1530123 RepID=UPI00294006E1|nr:bacteriophage abortive infection AbiH family protein [Acinetobacter seifertii]MDV4264817.1 bacteriophage abortive infection AbiH family protein [Acinetobacter seifertii]